MFWIKKRSDIVLISNCTIKYR